MPQDSAHRPNPNPRGAPSSDSARADSRDGFEREDAQGAGTYFLGRYRVVDDLGIGGMASVHLARMDGPGGFQKWVAVKKIHSHLVEDMSFVQMFLDEARVAARISHPNVAAVFDLGKHKDTYWIAMEYLHGEPLREVMRRTEELGTAMPPEIACRVIADAAEGLHAAHELVGKNGEQLGLVHRDVTPHNLFVTYDGVTKVVDFGIAKFNSRTNVTRAGTLKGKLAYMSPEQVHGEAIDRRTDIFALGVVLWELTTGQRLFRMENDIDTLAKVQECNVPPPSSLVRGYPIDLENIVMTALAKKRGDRFRTARELSRALQSLLMRRGLFIVSDEVATYVRSIFTDRIETRDAHLRWASEVTQTINVDHLLSKPQLGSEFTTSEVYPAANPDAAKPISPAPAARPLPAAGIPARRPSVAPLDADPVSRAVMETGASLTSPQVPSVRVGGRPRKVVPPRPAAGAPPQRSTSRHPDPASTDSEAHKTAPLPSTSDLYDTADDADPPTLLAKSLQERVLERLGGGPTSSAFVDTASFDEDGVETVISSNALALGSTTQDAGRLADSRRVGSDPPKTASLRAGPTAALPSNLPEVLTPARAEAAAAEESTFDSLEPPPSLLHRAPPSAAPEPSSVRTEGALPPREGRHAPTVRRAPTETGSTPPRWALLVSAGIFVALVTMAVMFRVFFSSDAARRSGDPSPASRGPFAIARDSFDSALTAAAANVPPSKPVPMDEAAHKPEPAPGISTAIASAAAPSPSPNVAHGPVTVSPPSPSPSTPSGTTPPSPSTVSPMIPALNGAQPNTKRKQGGLAIGGLTVVCMPKCDEILDNGISLGPGHIFNRPVAAGKHVLVLSTQSGVKKTMQVDVVPDQTREVRVSMDKP